MPDLKSRDGFKASETLLGIETGGIGSADRNSNSFKASETLLGIETQGLGGASPCDWLQSLWNPFRDWNAAIALTTLALIASFKASETLLGIETLHYQI